MQLEGIIIISIVSFAALLLLIKWLRDKSKKNNSTTTSSSSLSPSLSSSSSSSTLSLDLTQENQPLVSTDRSNSGSTISLNSPTVSPVLSSVAVTTNKTPNEIPSATPSETPRSTSSGPSSGPSSRPSSVPPSGPPSVPPSVPPSGPPSVPPSGPPNVPPSVPPSGPSSEPSSGPPSDLSSGILSETTTSNRISTTSELINQPTQSEIEDKAWNDAPIEQDISFELEEYKTMADNYNINKIFPINDNVIDELSKNKELNDQQLQFLGLLNTIVSNIINAKSRNDKLKIIDDIKYDGWSFTESNLTNLRKFSIVINKFKNEVSMLSGPSINVEPKSGKPQLFVDLSNLDIYLNSIDSFAYNKETFNKLVEGEVIGPRPLISLLRLFFTACYDSNYSIDSLPINSDECFEWYKNYREILDRIKNLEKILVNDSLDNKTDKILLRIDNNFKRKFNDVTDIDFDYAYRTLANQIAEIQEGYTFVSAMSGGSVKTKEKSNDLKYIAILSLIIFSLSFIKR